MTSRYTSWRMVLFGDPLYNPWRGKGYVNELHGILQSNVVGQSGFPLPPSTLPFKDPLKARQVVKQARETLLAQVDTLLERLERPKQSSP